MAENWGLGPAPSIAKRGLPVQNLHSAGLNRSRMELENRRGKLHRRCIITTREDGTIVSANPFAVQLFGFSSDELIGSNVSILIPPPYKESHNTYIRRYLTTGEKNVIDQERIVEGQTKSGEVFPCSLSVKEVWQENERWFVGTIRKVHKIRPEITINREGVVTAFSPDAEKIFGYREEEVKGRNVSMLMPSAHAAKHDSYIQRYEKTRVKRVVDITRNVLAKHRDGSLFPIALNVQDFGDHFRGSVLPVTGLDAMLTIDARGYVRSCSRSFTELLFGYKPDIVIGQHISRLLPHFSQVFTRKDSDNSHNTGNTFERSASNESSSSHTGGSAGGCPSSGSILTKEKSTSSAHTEGSGGITEAAEKSFVNRTGALLARHSDGSMFKVRLRLKRFFDHATGELLYSARIARGDVKQSDHVRLGSNVSGGTHIGKILFNRYDVIRLAGEGGFGTVYYAYDRVADSEVALKVLQKRSIPEWCYMNDPHLGRIPKEIYIQKLLDHPNILPVNDVIDCPEEIYLVMPWGNGGDLHNWLVEGKGCPYTEDEARVLFKQILSAVQHLHNLNFCHRDLKAENLMFLDKEHTQLQLIDFGAGTWISRDHNLADFCGTASYASPEILLGLQYAGPEVDVWSLGVVLHCMVLMRMPFQNTAHAAQGLISYSQDDNLSPECENLIFSMLKTSAKGRITLEEVWRHPWMHLGEKKGPVSFADRVPSLGSSSVSPQTLHGHNVLHPNMPSATASAPTINTPQTQSPSQPTTQSQPPAQPLMQPPPAVPMGGSTNHHAHHAHHSHHSQQSYRHMHHPARPEGITEFAIPSAGGSGGSVRAHCFSHTAPSGNLKPHNPGSASARPSTTTPTTTTATTSPPTATLPGPPAGPATPTGFIDPAAGAPAAFEDDAVLDAPEFVGMPGSPFMHVEPNTPTELSNPGDAGSGLGGGSLGVLGDGMFGDQTNAAWAGSNYQDLPPTFNPQN